MSTTVSLLHVQTNCLEATYKPHGDDISSMAECITDDINFCVDTIPTRTVRYFPNNKPWITSDLKELLNMGKKRAFREGDGDMLRSVPNI